VKILALCGSPKRRNCYSVLSWVEKNYPDIDYKLLMLGELNLEQCQGFYDCSMAVRQAAIYGQKSTYSSRYLFIRAKC